MLRSSCPPPLDYHSTSPPGCCRWSLGYFPAPAVWNTRARLRPPSVGQFGPSTLTSPIRLLQRATPRFRLSRFGSEKPEKATIVADAIGAHIGLRSNLTQQRCPRSASVGLADGPIQAQDKILHAGFACGIRRLVVGFRPSITGGAYRF